jgi:hypothetical protein
MAMIQRWLIGVVFLGLVLVVQGCETRPPTAGPGGARPAAARDKGAREATESINAGKLMLKEYPPLPSPAGHQEYVQLLKEKCGVEYQVPNLPAGVKEDDFIQEVRGWNDTMQAEIQRRFGADILDRLREEGRKRWQEKSPPKGRA